MSTNEELIEEAEERDRDIAIDEHRTKVFARMANLAPTGRDADGELEFIGTKSEFKRFNEFRDHENVHTNYEIGCETCFEINYAMNLWSEQDLIDLHEQEAKEKHYA